MLARPRDIMLTENHFQEPDVCILFLAGFGGQADGDEDKTNE